jgi:NAD(P)-dependent dehydrogenase (short-subunit alcohol dehydrogenase family)
LNNYLIIGASGGIGNAIVGSLSKENHNIYATYNKNYPENLKNIASLFQLDVTSDSPDFGFIPESLSGLVYCPGSIMLKPFHRITAEEFALDYQLQLIGAVKIIQAALPALKKIKSSSIVLYSTVAVGSGFKFHSLVSSSKGAVEGLTKALAADLAPDIRVNCIAPSITDTPLASNFLNTESKRDGNAKRHPLGRIGNALDIAEMTNFLLSDKSDWITGQIFRVDGGISSIKI